jgi:hypothetical protein
VGDEVTILDQEDGDPYILNFQYYGHIVEIRPAGYVVEMPPTALNMRVGPLPERRLTPGWRDKDGRWRTR